LAATFGLPPHYNCGKGGANELKAGKVLIKNAEVLTMQPQADMLSDCSVAVADGKILAVGPPPAGFNPDEVIDGRNHLVMPGFFNAHCHAAMVLLRGSAEDLPIDRWFNEGIWRSESALNEEDVYWGTALAVCEMIRGGTVAFADHYFWMRQVARVVEESGMKALLAWCTFGAEGTAEMGNVSLDEILAFTTEYRDRADGRIKTMCGPHSPYVTTRKWLRKIAGFARQSGLGCHIHVAETSDQVRQSLASEGATPVAYLAETGVFDNPSIAAHAIHISKEDVDILKKKGVSVVSCPKTHMKLAMSTTRVSDLVDAGINVAIGTDGAASSNNLDMLEAMRLASLLSKHDRQDAASLPAWQVLRLATTGGANAMGFVNSGSLHPGADADLILIDLDKPHLTPRHSYTANIVHSAVAADISHVFVDGRMLLNKGCLITLDEERIKHEAQRRGVRMVASPTGTIQRY
jgi:5-methylthioadenosine/S-adenosylhomocysteine deaminase